ncbi:MAG TPA: 8-amino-7-oxononanoate synthase, partial [Casimicrobiaceae bacterium]
MLAELEAALERRRADGLMRERRVVEIAQGPRIRFGDQTLLAFASNDYLGLANAPELVDALCAS